MRELLEFYADEGPERLGFVLDDGTVVELENKHPDPCQGSSPDPWDVIKYEDRIAATWHTHPGASSNLSAEDYMTIENYPNTSHFVVGKDGVSCYRMKDGIIIVDE